MEVSSSLHHHLSDSSSYGWLKQVPPSFDRLTADSGAHSFGSSRSSFIDMDPADLFSRSSFIDMDPADLFSRSSFIDMDLADLFSLRWTASTSDFDFGPQGGGGDGAASPAQLVSASQIFHGGRLLPYEPGGCSSTTAQQDADGWVARRASDAMPGAPRTSAPSSPLFHSAQSMPLSLSACSSATSKHARARSTRRGGSPWNVLLRYVRFLPPLYRKARAPAAPRHTHTMVVPAASPSRGSTSSVEWCHGNADTAVHDAILYCKKSSGQDQNVPP